MLFGYPVAATNDNWLHECLCAAIHSIHTACDAHKSYPAWPRILPAQHRATLKRRKGLRDRLLAYNRAIRRLSKADRDAVLEALEAENRISELLSGACDCLTIDSLPELVREPVEELFGFAFGLLTDLDVRDQQYASIYAAVPEHTCPFCGTEYFDAPGAAREALDHYLTKSRYPFAAANLRNLVPMGHKCNSSYKLSRDLLRRADGSRRVAFDPYNHPAPVRIVLDESVPFAGVDATTPKWEIRFDPETPTVPTWDEVFSVRERYRRDHLDPSFFSWLGLFRAWARTEGIQADSDSSLIAALRRHEESWAPHGYQDRAFLKAAVFRMLRLHCEKGHPRLMAMIRDLVMPPAATSKAASPTANAAGGAA